MAGHQVVTAIHGEDALSRFGAGTFDLVVTDLSLGGMSGFEVARRVKQLNPSVPVILLTGWAVEQHEDLVQDAGIDAVLIKPCRLEDLFSAVQEAIRPPVGT